MRTKICYVHVALPDRKNILSVFGRDYDKIVLLKL